MLPLIVAVALAIAWTNFRTSQFEAEATVILTPSAAEEALQGTNQNSTFLARELSNEVSIAQSDDVTSRVIALLAERGYDSLAENQRRTLNSGEITADLAGDLLLFRARTTSGETAAALSNAWADGYIEWKRFEAQESVALAIDSLRLRLGDLEDRRNEIDDPNSLEQVLLDSELGTLSSSITALQLSSDLAATGTARVIQRAAAPNGPSDIPQAVLIAVAIVLGLGLGVGLALLKDALFDSFRSADEVEQILGVPVLGNIPRPSRHASRDLALETAEFASSPLAAAYRSTQASLEFHLAANEFDSILVTSARPSEGKTTTSANLAWTHASAGYYTTLIDVDFHRPRLHQVFSVNLAPGLSDVITEGIGHQPYLRRTNHPLDTLRLMPAGNSVDRRSDFVTSPSFESGLEEFFEESDLLILDCSPVLAVSDATTLAPLVDGVVLTVMAEETSIADVQEAINRVVRAGGRIIGVVLTNVRENRNRSYNYSYEYSPRELESASSDSSTSTSSTSSAPTAETAREPVQAELEEIQI